MGKGCAFQYCRTNKGRYQYDYGISCFRFPKNEIRETWIKAINRGQEWQPTKDTVVCERHFSVEDLLLYNGLTRIKPGAVPKLHLSDPPPEVTKHKTRRRQNANINIRPNNVDTPLLPTTEDLPLPVSDYNIYCRLCAQAQDDSAAFQILSAEIIEKLDSFLPGLKQHENLLMSCCSCCLDQINEIICFKEQCEKAEEKLLEIQTKNDVIPPEIAEPELEIEVLPVPDMQFEQIYLAPAYENRPKGSRAKFYLEEFELIKDQSPPYSCPYCDKVVKTPTGFRLHILFIHKNHSTKNYKKLESFGLSSADGRPNLLFECPACQLVFKQKRDVVEHIKTHDFSDEEELRQIEEKVNGLAERPEIMFKKAHLCELCGKSFRQKIGLDVHMKFHLKQKDYECDQCGKKFYMKGDLTLHLAFHAGVTYKCPMCPKEFRSQNALRTHKRTHTDNAYKYECKLCEKKFMAKYKLSYHMDKHAGRRSFTCEKCGKGFLYNYMRDQHLMKDHGVKIEGRKIYKEKKSESVDNKYEDENLTSSEYSE